MRNYQNNPDHDVVSYADFGVGNGDYTVAFWYRHGTSNIAWRGVFSQGGGNITSIWMMVTGVALYTHLGFSYFTDIGVWSEGQIAHCVVTRKAGTSFVWTNGTKDATSVANTNTWVAGITYIGEAALADRSIEADLGEVAIWNQALSEADIKKLAARFSPATVSPASLKAYWPLDGDTWDHAGGNHVTSTTGTPTWADSVGVVRPPAPTIFLPTAAPASIAGWDIGAAQQGGWDIGAAQAAESVVEPVTHTRRGPMRNYQNNPDYDQTGDIRLGIGTGDFTVSFWILRGNQTSWRGILTGDPAQAARFPAIYGMDWGNPWRIRSGGTNYGFDTWHLADTLYHHVVRRVGTTVSGWVDGVQEATTHTISASFTDAPVRLGNTNEGGTGSLDGDLGEVAIWNTALSEQDIYRLAEGMSPSVIARSSLKAHWPLEGDLLDHAGHAHITSTTGTPTWDVTERLLLTTPQVAPRVPQYWPVIAPPVDPPAVATIKRRPIQLGPLNQTSPLARGLIGAWPFDGNETHILRDRSAYRAHATLQTGTVELVNTNVGRAIQFNSTEYYAVPSHSPCITAPFDGPTTVLLLAAKDVSSYDNAALAWGADTGGSTDLIVYPYDGTGSGEFRTYFRDFGGSLSTSPLSINATGINAFIHVTDRATYRTLFVNGVQVATATPALSATSTFDSMYIGGWNNDGSPAQHFGAANTGQIAGVFVWNRVLTDEEIRRVSRDPWQMFRPRVPQYWPVVDPPVSFRKRVILLG